ncbi:MAG: molybdenum cofactor biosynthesis protein MoaE [Candidatus Nitrotoga sp.]|nr:molybdenum cofactor biosynthesis protein MoaE [Candidatus Nitrotoga sp.]MDO9446641.1 molybdenum cofactor biosynthesis protein MoaE [Candidatus Nitrotoga sp.]
MSVLIQEDDFDLAAELAALRSGNSKVGAMVSFVGLVRDFSHNETIESIYLEYYPGMTEKALNKIITEATERWSLINVRVIHRIGQLFANDQIVLVATTALHRGEAFAGCEFIIDYLKTAAPFWKKEQTREGSQWLETRETDVKRMEHWHNDTVRKSA